MNSKLQIKLSNVGDSKYVKLTCIMSGFEGNKTSKAKWSTDFEDPQISKSDSGPTWIDNDNGYAGWEVNINVSHKDSGDKVNIKQKHTVSPIGHGILILFYCYSSK